jgi:hypothetical protein
MARVVGVEHLGGYQLRLTFSDRLVRDLDFAGALSGGVFEELRDPTVFSQVSIDEVAGTITFPNGVDFDPDVLHGDEAPADGTRLRLLRERRLEQAG